MTKSSRFLDLVAKLNVIRWKAKMEFNLEQGIETALDIVYQLDNPTPLEAVQMTDGKTVWLKREDASRIHSYKWRGAFNKLTHLVKEGNVGPFVTTSAGNHAQGVAASARKLGIKATIFMPRSTPKLKQRSVMRHGGDAVEVVLVGDSFEQAQQFAHQYARDRQATILPPFDDWYVVAGQATVGVEILQQWTLASQKISSNPNQPDILFVPVGGGGLISGVAAAIKWLSPKVWVIGVEVEGQDSMGQSIKANQRLTLSEVDTFCDGTAVASPGERTFQCCQLYADEFITVTNDQVCQAIQSLWDERRLVTEPSGAIAMAGFLEYHRPENSVVILSGSNTDFSTIPTIVRKSQLSQPTRRHYQFEINEENGALISLLDSLGDEVNIIDFQYGKSAYDRAWPVLGFQATEDEWEHLAQRLKDNEIKADEVTGDDAVSYRVIALQPDLTSHPTYLRIDFPDRPGALRDLMRRVSDLTNICYFNFLESGELEGHALIGFEFAREDHQASFFSILKELKFSFRELKTNHFEKNSALESNVRI